MFKKLFGFGKKKEEVIENEIVENEELLEESEIEESEEDSVKEELLEKTISEKVQEETTCEENKTVTISEKDIKSIEEDMLEEETIEEEFKLENDIETNCTDEEGMEETIEEELNEGREKPSFAKESLFSRLKQGLIKAKQGITDRIDDVLKSYTSIDEDLFEDLEEVLITADVGVNTTMEIIEELNDRVRKNKITNPMDVREELKGIVEEILSKGNSKLDIEASPSIIIMVGVNGVGKTTTIGKLALRYKSEGKKVMLAAADTFRAAATEQLDIWAKRTNTEIVKHHEGADPGAVIFDAIKAAKARKTDVLICDTAGRLHNKSNLMNELGKIFKIIDREYPEAKKEVLLVVDATTGQNAVVQAKSFKEVADITGIVLTKLDGTAKGGVVLAVKSEVDVPVKLIGVGEKAEDLQDFDAKAFTDALFGN
ncbi:signal recognition particle-docking protein FtsY [Peptacetobacter sp.]|uniref:signal recognition particle-docking protein FtsY n=1 Tax=Peptacetobacter sp. TaxID=2991975 RepID=UPI0026031D25|nr:signal recognition particle-docking protein FtsY [Peptacetobacter sp.]